MLQLKSIRLLALSVYICLTTGYLCPEHKVTVSNSNSLRAALKSAKPGTVIHMNKGFYEGAFVASGRGIHRFNIYLRFRYHEYNFKYFNLHIHRQFEMFYPTRRRWEWRKLDLDRKRRRTCFNFQSFPIFPFFSFPPICPLSLCKTACLYTRHIKTQHTRFKPLL